MCVRSHAHPGAVPRRDDIILVVSTLEPRKNGPFLLDWFCKTEALPPGMQLWWVGPQGWWTSRKYLADLSRQARRATKGRVKLLGMVPDARLCALYRRAAFTIYPSLYEGFGFPVLDSLLHGAPVLCGFNSSLEEFATNGVFYFDVGDAGTLDAACRACLAARPVAIDREWLASRFSWDGLARQVLDLAA
jgi:glycosyltransferase involved in cell wall biosynthesis